MALWPWSRLSLLRGKDSRCEWHSCNCHTPTVCRFWETQPSTSTRAGPSFYMDCLPYLYLYSIPFPFYSFYISSLLIPPCPLLFLYRSVTQSFLLLSAVFSYSFPNISPHSFCLTFQQFVHCVSQLRTNSLVSPFLLATKAFRESRGIEPLCF
jgi:hypothetical protein